MCIAESLMRDISIPAMVVAGFVNVDFGLIVDRE